MAPKASTTIDTISAALIAAFRSRAELVDMIISDGPPTAGEYAAPEWIALLDVEFEQTAHAMNVSNRPREERYTQTVLITVVRTSQRNEGSSTRAWELFREVEQAIRTNPTLQGFYTGTGQIVSAQVGAGRFSKRAGDEQRESAIQFGIRVHARI